MRKIDADERARVIDALVRWGDIITQLGQITKDADAALVRGLKGGDIQETETILLKLMGNVSNLQKTTQDHESWPRLSDDFSIEVLMQLIMGLDEAYCWRSHYLAVCGSLCLTAGQL